MFWNKFWPFLWSLWKSATFQQHIFTRNNGIWCVTGGLAVLWFVVWCFVISESPAKHSTITNAELEYIQSGIGYTDEQTQVWCVSTPLFSLQIGYSPIRTLKIYHRISPPCWNMLHWTTSLVFVSPAKHRGTIIVWTSLCYAFRYHVEEIQIKL